MQRGFSVYLIRGVYLEHRILFMSLLDCLMLYLGFPLALPQFHNCDIRLASL